MFTVIYLSEHIAGLLFIHILFECCAVLIQCFRNINKEFKLADRLIPHKRFVLRKLSRVYCRNICRSIITVRTYYVTVYSGKIYSGSYFSAVKHNSAHFQQFVITVRLGALKEVFSAYPLYIHKSAGTVIRIYVLYKLGNTEIGKRLR